MRKGERLPEYLRKIEINEKFGQALELLENSDDHLLITGKAGTGKSTLLEYWNWQTEKPLVVLAPTGVAAVNVGGETIHAFFGFKPGVTVKEAKQAASKRAKMKIYQKIETLVIDEVSMVRADLMDCVDEFLRKVRKSGQPFGGVQMCMIGDLYQLPPVVKGEERQALAAKYASPYFFDSEVMQKLINGQARRKLVLVELEKIYRQSDDRFIKLLNAVRNRSIDDGQLAEFNRRWRPKAEDEKGEYIYLTSLNRQADEINWANIEKLPGKPKVYRAAVSGRFDAKSFPTEAELKLKKRAQVMLINNDRQGRWINGTVGTVAKLEEEGIRVKLDDGELVEVKPFGWSLFKMVFNPQTKMIEKQEVGVFEQLPVRLAWAITIHKSQGKTFDRVMIDVGRGTFAHGQMYVALSRCRSLEGMILKQMMKKSHVILDWRVVKFLTGWQYQLSEERLPVEEKVSLIKEVIGKKGKLEIEYLKSKDVRSKRVIRPKRVEEMEYLGYEFLGMEAYCEERKADRVFRVEKILKMREV